MIKKFKAPTMQEAMKLAKMKLGQNAVVLESRKVRHAGLFDKTAPEMVEITVTSDQSVARSPVKEKPAAPTYSPARVQKAVNPAISPEIKSQLEELQQAVRDMSNYIRHDKMLLLPNTHRFLIHEKGVEEGLASELIQRAFLSLEGPDLKDESRITQVLEDEITNSLRIESNVGVASDGPKVICLVGPTGVGKTTSTIKMATHPQFYGNKRVGLITIDTYRVAAAAQLKTFAALAKLPLEIVYSPEDMAAAIENFRDVDAILIDTAGRSPLNKQHLNELKAFFTQRQPDEIHLVLSLSTHADSMVETVKNFAPLSVNRVMLTKIDETSRIGNILNLGTKIDVPISFLTNGQRVPDDILLADERNTAKLILN